MPTAPRWRKIDARNRPRCASEYETSISANRPREVDRDAAILEDHPRDRLGVRRGQRRDLDRAEQLAVQPVVRRVADLEVDVGDAALDAEREELVERVAIHGPRSSLPDPGRRQFTGLPSGRRLFGEVSGRAAGWIRSSARAGGASSSLSGCQVVRQAGWLAALGIGGGRLAVVADRRRGASWPAGAAACAAGSSRRSRISSSARPNTSRDAARSSSARRQLARRLASSPSSSSSTSARHREHRRLERAGRTMRSSARTSSRSGGNGGAGRAM